MAKFSDIYDVSISWLISSEVTEGQSKKVELAAREFSKLKPEDLDRILNLLKALKSRGDDD